VTNQPEYVDLDDHDVKPASEPAVDPWAKYSDIVETMPPAQRNHARVRGEKNQAIEDARNSKEYKRLRALFRAACARHRNPDGSIGAWCWLGNHPINYESKFPAPDCWTVDHKIPATHAPQLICDPLNFAAACWSCNHARGAGETFSEGDLGEPSEEW
jgi:5-methylcytosine-specific restriction endonuclease McrA